MSKVYHFKAYDKYLCLKPSFELWLVILFLLRPYVMLASTMRMGRGGANVQGTSFLKDLVYPDDLSMILGIIATIPVLPFMLAWKKRKPGASDFYRKLWYKSALLLVLSSVLGIVAIVLPLAMGLIYEINPLGWVQIAISIAIIPYLLFSERVKDTFMDYPDELSNDRQGVGVSGK